MFIKTIILSIAFGFLMLFTSDFSESTLEDIFNAVVLILISCFFIIYLVEQVIDVVNTFINPTTDLLKPIIQALEPQIELTNKLKKFKSSELQLVIDRLNFDTNRIKSRLGLLVGAIERLGIVPFIIALFFTSHKFLTSDPMSSKYTIGLFLISGIYFGALMCSRALLRFEYFKLVLNDAKSTVLLEETKVKNKKAHFSQLKSKSLKS